MSESLEAFADFKSSLKNKTTYSNGDISFQGKVIYNWNGQSEQETLQVSLIMTGVEYGKVRIEDGDMLTVDTVHMDFNPDFQDYKFTTEGFFVIKGSSSKVGGSYKVKIIEV